MARREVAVAIVGVGNCASALVQGVAWCRERDGDCPGVGFADFGGIACRDIRFVAAYDVDKRKVGRPLEEAIFQEPNCARRFHVPTKSSGPLVEMSPILDGIAPHLADYPDDRAFRPASAPPVDITESLRISGAEVLICYLPVGSEQAVRHYADCCLQAGVAFINCVPVFIASDPQWREAFRAKGLPLIGDDIKSQLGATIVHRALAHLFEERGILVRRTYQLNVGGNTDFLNMLARDRLVSKKKSKTESVRSQLARVLPDTDIHIGPSDYVPWMEDNKVCFLRFEGDGFGGLPIELELRLSVQDSPNSAGVVIDLIRGAALARDRGMGGEIPALCAYYMKSPPEQLPDAEARSALMAFIGGQ